MLLFDVGIHVSWIDSTQKIDVFIGVKLGHFTLSGRFSTLMYWLF